MEKKNKVLFFVCILLISLVFAYLITNLVINGELTIGSNTWDIHLENIVVKEGSVETEEDPTIVNDTEIEVSVNLTQPGDYYGFVVDLTNDGTIDAMIGDIDVGLDEDQSKYLEVIYHYFSEDGRELQENDLLGAGESTKVYVEIKFKDDVDPSDYPEEDETIDFTITISYVQADENANPVIDMVLDDENGNGVADVGEVLTIDTENFYVISNDNGIIKALAEYNLYVGGETIGSSGSYSSSNIYGSEATNLQDEDMKGFVSNDAYAKGVVPFAYLTYWSANQDIDLNNRDNIVIKFLNNYQKLLEEKEGVIENISLITKTELEALDCDFTGYSCADAPEWVNNTSYWASSSTNDSSVYYNSNGTIGYQLGAVDIALSGVRPVITVKNGNVRKVAD